MKIQFAPLDLVYLFDKVKHVLSLKCLAADQSNWFGLGQVHAAIQYPTLPSYFLRFSPMVEAQHEDSHSFLLRYFVETKLLVPIEYSCGCVGVGAGLLEIQVEYPRAGNAEASSRLDMDTDSSSEDTADVGLDNTDMEAGNNSEGTEHNPENILVLLDPTAASSVCQKFK